jgi:hypothetical protein
VINVQYGPSAITLSQLARATGRGQLATQQQQVDNANQRYLLGLQEQQRQFDTQTANAAYNAQAARDMQRQQMAASQAAQQQALAANVFNQQAARQANIYGDQLDYQNAQENRDAQWQMQGVDSAEQMAKDALLAANKMNLDPEGKRKLAQLASDFRAIAAQRGVSIRDGAPYEGVLRDWLSDFDNSGLDDHEEREPSPEEWFKEGTFTDERGNVWARDRNGAILKRDDAPPRPLAPEEIEANTYQLPGGGTMFINPLDGKPYFPSNAPKENAKKETDWAPYVEKARKSLYDIWGTERDNAKFHNSELPKFNPTDDELLKEAKRLYGLEQRLSSEFGGGAAIDHAVLRPGDPGFDGPAQMTPLPNHDPNAPVEFELLANNGPRMEFKVVGKGESNIIQWGNDGKPTVRYMPGDGTQAMPLQLGARDGAEAIAEALPPGTWFIAPDGSLRQR